MIKRLLPILLLFCILSQAEAKLTVFDRKWTDTFPKVPDLFQTKSEKGLSPLAKLKWYEKKKKWHSCLRASAQQISGKELQLWVGNIHLECLRELYVRLPNTKMDSLVTHFNKIKPAKGVLLQSPHSGHKEKLLSTFLEISEKALDRKRALLDDFLNNHHDLVDQMNKSQRARYYRILGELAWQKQKNDLAIQNFLRSYQFNADPRVMKRLVSLKAKDMLDNEVKTMDSEHVYSDEENKYFNQYDTARKKGNNFLVVKHGVEYLKRYPGSGRVDDIADRVIVSFRKVLYRRNKKYQAMLEDMIYHLKKAPPNYIADWADSVFQRNFYQPAYELADVAADKLEGTRAAAKPLLVLGKSAYYMANTSKAKKYFLDLVEKYRGRPESDAAHYYLGLLYFREGSFDKVIPLYEKFLLMPGSDHWELQVRYWLWRSLEQTKSARATKQAQAILKKFPLTYYGLQVRFSTTGNLQSLFNEKKPNATTQYWWTTDSKNRWNRMKKLLRHGWIEEAEREIDLLPSPTTAEAFLLRAQLWNSAQRPLRAMNALSEAIERKPEYLTKGILEMVFPVQFNSHVEAASKEHSIDKHLVFATIRQESGFVVDAVSTSYAMGLMQLVSVTGKETAKWLRVRRFRWPEDILEPKTNIRFGTHYIKRMVRKYNGVVPLAMAAYNAGPGNIDRWLKNRTDLAGWENFGSQVVDDMWMDELPWGETSFYVKAILRNYLLYKIIFSGADKLSTPVWDDAQSVVPAGKAS